MGQRREETLHRPPFGAEAVHEVHDVEGFGVGHLGRLKEAGGQGVTAGADLVLEAGYLLRENNLTFYDVPFAANEKLGRINQVVKHQIAGCAGNHGLIVSLAPGRALEGDQSAVA